ncbi:hypothetical protein EDF46_0090 [Frondihabitans sp. PhB188]|uniref:hypothetical protein n=1 Tax=Frondihabitans sp. PhB188 TaxID=2485200 RepID=UPI000F4ACC3B|nr:hypothetical protein [Frondihabitans sp. PhB188]ROQ40729.1 hypothetical protein EDF46_0090 [Frondihabitans sp. PhB188]
MQRITYASGSIVTGDRIADAIGRYAQALALNEKSDLVSFPIVLASGLTATAKILIGPASQLLMVPEPSDYDDVEDAGVVADIERLTAALGMPRPLTEDDPEIDDAYPTDY